jgi:sporulation protein YlmC with PRC-barrel domain
MEAAIRPEMEASSLLSSELWGRQVYEATGRRLGVVDSVVRTHRGGVKAVVRNGRRHAVLVELEAATFDGEAIVVPWSRAESSTRAKGASASWRRLWPAFLRQE